MDRLNRAAQCAAAWTVISLSTSLGAQGVISPADRAGFEGSNSTSYPLGRHDCRVQTLHADLGSAARTIAGHAYRRDAIATRDRVDGWQADLAVELSVARNAPGSASRTFAANAATNPTLVLPRTTVSFPATNRPGTAPAPTFELTIPYPTAFGFPGAGATLCVDVRVFGNRRGGNSNVNFTAYLDAHEVFGDGRNTQPGYRFGAGCAAIGSNTAHTARFTFRETGAGLELDLASRNGIAHSVTDPVITGVIVGLQTQGLTWPAKPACTVYPTVDATFVLPGTSDSRGHWDGTLTGIPTLPVGQRFVTQMASLNTSQTDVTMSDGSFVVVPPPGATTVTAVRIANGSDHLGPTGSISRTVPVTRFF